MPRSAYRLDTPRGAHWSERARCARPDVDPDWWCTDKPKQAAAAIHICRRHCHVREQCLAATVAAPSKAWVQIVAGGVWFNQHGNVSQWQPEAKTCHLCRVSAVGLSSRRRMVIDNEVIVIEEVETIADALAFIDVRPYGTLRCRELS